MSRVCPTEIAAHHATGRLVMVLQEFSRPWRCAALPISTADVATFGTLIGLDGLLDGLDARVGLRGAGGPDGVPGPGRDVVWPSMMRDGESGLDRTVATRDDPSRQVIEAIDVRARADAERRLHSLHLSCTSEGAHCVLVFLLPDGGTDHEHSDLVSGLALAVREGSEVHADQSVFIDAGIDVEAFETVAIIRHAGLDELAAVQRRHLRDALDAPAYGVESPAEVPDENLATAEQATGALMLALAISAAAAHDLITEVARRHQVDTDTVSRRLVDAATSSTIPPAWRSALAQALLLSTPDAVHRTHEAPTVPGTHADA